jgi:hypothetical protein
MFKNSGKRQPKITTQTRSLVDFRSESVTMRLDRIAAHYVDLEQVLAELEAKMPEPPPSEVVPQLEAADPRKPR